MSKVIERQACPNCKSSNNDWDSNNLVMYEDGGSHCFACKYTIPSSSRGLDLPQNTSTFCNKNTYKSVTPENKMKINGEYKALIDRGISEETCRKANYMLGTFGKSTVHIMDYGVSQKLRFENKDFIFEPGLDGKHPGMYGLDDNALDFSKRLFIVEGEIDKLSLNEIGEQAISVSRGAGSVEKDLKNDFDKLLKFKHIILFFDNDDVGKDATKTAVKILQSDKLQVLDFKDLNYKDANDLLRAGILKDIIDNNCKEIVPDGLLFGTTLDIDKLKHSEIKSIPLPWPILNESMGGLEYGCLYMFLAGTSVGKSSLLRELAYHYRNTLPDLKIANFFLEENEEVTPLAFAAIHNNVPLGNLRRNRNLLSNDQWEDVRAFLSTDNLMFINGNFNKSAANMLKQIEYLVKVKKTDLIIIDHISYIIGRSGISKHGERRDVDEFIYALQDLVQRLGCIVVAVSHVNESASAKRWDEGEVPNIYSGRSSKVLAQVPDGIIGLSRNMTNGNSCDILSLYNLKNRWFSKLGKCDELHYDSEKGRLLTLEQIFPGGRNEQKDNNQRAE